MLCYTIATVFFFPQSYKIDQTRNLHANTVGNSIMFVQQASLCKILVKEFQLTSEK